MLCCSGENLPLCHRLHLGKTLRPLKLGLDSMSLLPFLTFTATSIFGSVITVVLFLRNHALSVYDVYAPRTTLFLFHSLIC